MRQRTPPAAAKSASPGGEAPRLTWAGDATECGRFALQRARLRQSGETETEWRVILRPIGRVVACTGNKPDARKAAQRIADDIEAGRDILFME